MRVVGIFLNPEIRTGGHRRYLEFFQAIAEKGHKVFLIINAKLEYSFNNITEIRLDYNYKKRFVPYSVVSLQRIKRSKNLLLEKIESCDFIVIHGETHLLAGVYIKKLFSTKLLFALRSNGVVEAQMKRREAAIPILQKIKFILSEYKYRQYEKIIIKNADIIAFQSAFDKESLLSRNKNYLENAVVIPGNIGGKWFDPAYKDSNSSEKLKTIIFIGAINQRKGIKYLIEAFIKLIEVGYDLELVIAGKGVLENKIKAMLEQANVFERVRFIGRVNNPLEHIAKADLMIVPSIFDSFPDVILESLHVGTPVLAANSGGVADMVSKYDLFEVANSEAIIDKILILLGSDDEYRKLKANQQKYRDRFNFDWAQSFISEMEKY